MLRERGIFKSVGLAGPVLGSVKINHTKLPWHGNIVKNGGDWTYRIEDADGREVAESNKYLEAKGDANSEFILYACNNIERVDTLNKVLIGIAEQLETGVDPLQVAQQARAAVSAIEK